MKKMVKSMSAAKINILKKNQNTSIVEEEKLYNIRQYSSYWSIFSLMEPKNKNSGKEANSPNFHLITLRRPIEVTSIQNKS